MTWQVMEYMQNNPDASPIDVMNYFAKELEIDKQIQCIRNEVDTIVTIREALRPLYGQKMNDEAEMALIDSEMEMKVMEKYPPRHGSEKERKAYKRTLQKEDKGYRELDAKIQEVKDKITLLEEEMADVEQRAKNARRLLDTFNGHASLLISLNSSNKKLQLNEEASNTNIF